MLKHTRLLRQFAWSQEYTSEWVGELRPDDASYCAWDYIVALLVDLMQLSAFHASSGVSVPVLGVCIMCV